MGNFSEKISRSVGRLVDSFKEFPLEALLGAVYFLIFVLQGPIGHLVEDFDVFNFSTWFFPQYVLLFCIDRLSRNGARPKYFPYLAWVLWIPLLLFGNSPDGWMVAISYLVTIVFLFLGEKKLSDSLFARNIIHTVVRVAAAFLVGGIMMLLVMAIVGSVSFLFSLDLGDEWFTYPLSFVAFIVIPLMCCALVSAPSSEGKGIDSLVKTVVDYVLSPALVLYAVILYAYIIRILVKWELPEGGVAYMVCGFLSVALLCTLLRNGISNPRFGWFYKALPAVCAAPLVLLWIGAFRRIGEYGFTEPRIYLILLAALLTVFTVMLLGKGEYRFRKMALILMGVALLFTFVPGMRAKDLGIMNQKHRFEKILPSLLSDGRFKEPDYSLLSSDAALKSLWSKADGAYEYLKANMKGEKFKSLYGSYGEMVYYPWKTNESAYKINERWELDDLRTPLDLEGYTLFIPRRMYDLDTIDDGNENAILVKDFETGEVLIRCDLRRAGVSSDNPTDSLLKDELVYSNDTYRVILRSLGFYNDSYYNGELMLFKKP